MLLLLLLLYQLKSKVNVVNVVFLWTILQLLGVVCVVAALVIVDQLYIKESAESWLRVKLSEKSLLFSMG